MVTEKFVQEEFNAVLIVTKHPKSPVQELYLWNPNQKCPSVVMNLVIWTPVPMFHKTKVHRRSTLFLLYLTPYYCFYSTFRSESSTPTTNDPNQCYIVFDTMLMLLFAVCRHCGSKAVKVQKVIVGSFLRIKQQCLRCNRKFVWDSQPMIRKIPAGNIRLSAAILYAGAMPTKMIRVLTFMKCETISTDTYFRHQRDYLQPVVSTVYQSKQVALLSSLRNHPLVLAGDGRADSPGHSAKYGTYSVLEMSCSKIIDFKLVQVW